MAVRVTAALLAVPMSRLAADGWSGPTAIDKSNPPENISCPSVSFCVAVDTGGDAYIYDGTSWSAADPIDTGLTHDVSDRVSVTDFVPHRPIVLHAGRSYLAKAPPARK